MISEDARKFYASFNAPDFNAPVPVETAGRAAWLSDQAAGRASVGIPGVDNSPRSHPHMTPAFIPAARPGVMQPYHVAVAQPHTPGSTHLELGRDT